MCAWPGSQRSPDTATGMRAPSRHNTGHQNCSVTCCYRLPEIHSCCPPSAASWVSLTRG